MIFLNFTADLARKSFDAIPYNCKINFSSALKTQEIQKDLKCYHCGNDCAGEPVVANEKSFCCEGCKLVYEILDENGLCNYYDLNANPGLTQSKSELGQRFSFLDNAAIANQLLRFEEGNTKHITFHISKMHCSSCIWLLENFNGINKGVTSSRVDFLKKEMFVVFDSDKTSLRQIVEQLAVIGYEPDLHLDAMEKKTAKTQNRLRLYRIGVAGFCLGNIMLLSFPEYFSGGHYEDAWLRLVFGYLNLFLALPVVFFSSWEFYSSALKSFRQRMINIDVAIALGITAMFNRSAYEIITHTGAGYFDSMSGLVFFTLCGRWFQDKTFESLSFDRDFKSYFPIAVDLVFKDSVISKPVYEIKQNDIIKIRNGEIIPVDGILLSDVGVIDYSFVTGESHLVEKQKGEIGRAHV